MSDVLDSHRSIFPGANGKPGWARSSACTLVSSSVYYPITSRERTGENHICLIPIKAAFLHCTLVLADINQ
jgi:hypothetical protein